MPASIIVIAFAAVVFTVAAATVLKLGIREYFRAKRAHLKSLLDQDDRES